MKLPRRQFLHLAAGAAALPAVSRFAWGQAYPSRPVRMLVGFTAGSASDILARLMGQWLGDRLGQPFVIENRPGGGTNVAAEAVVRRRRTAIRSFWPLHQCHQRLAIRQAQLQFHPRYRAGRGHQPRAKCRRGEPIGSDQDRS